MGTALIDFSKAFNCIPPVLLAAKLHAHGLSEDAVNFVHSYLQHRKQGIKSLYFIIIAFQIFLSDIPQGSLLGPILSNVLINNLFSFIKHV